MRKKCIQNNLEQKILPLLPPVLLHGADCMPSEEIFRLLLQWGNLILTEEFQSVQEDAVECRLVCQIQFEARTFSLSLGNGS